MAAAPCGGGRSRATPARCRSRAARALAAHHGTEGLDIVSDPETVEPYYREASVVLAPVRAGGGAQVKVTEALARGRVVVASPFSAAAAPCGADAGLVVADGPEGFARRVLDLWAQPARRWAMERALVERRPVPTWDEAVAPLAEALLGAVPALRR
ncbi:MAG: glycosyltransferase [Actinobacteria bacterium]|nr:glycosyltransferase [Actinomycetota bacterium]